MWKSFTAGVAVGVGIGWLVFVGRGSDAPAEVAAPPAPVPAPTERPAREPRTRAAPASPGAASSPAPATALPAQPKDRPPAPLDYAALDLRVAEARRSGDWKTMREILDLLASARTPEARDRLLAYAEDDTFVFRDAPGGWYRRGFEGAGSARLVTAARRRFERDAAAHDRETAMRSGWLFPVVDHGTEADVAWLAETSKTGEYGDWIVEWMAESPSRTARARVEAEFRSGRGVARVLPKFCERWGEDAFAVAWEVAAPFFRGEPSAHDLAEGGLFRALGACVPKDRADEVRFAILACPDAERRIRGVEVAAGLLSRGFDRAPLEPLLAYPVEVLERLPSVPAAPRDGGIATRATYAIEYHRDWLWTPHAADALEACARRFGDAYPHEHLEKVAMLLRKDLADPWRRK